jgi:histone deacetylase complex regulatory component SIN3
MSGENAPRPTAVPAYPQQRPQRPPSPPGQHQNQHPHQHQQLQSPLTQLSPSTVKASPQQTPGPLDASGGSAEPSAKRGMRSQIACTRCRRSKTKCENTGQGTTCKACANTNRDCTWDHAAVASSTASVRRDSTADFDVRRSISVSSEAQSAVVHVHVYSRIHVLTHVTCASADTPRLHPKSGASC